MRENIPSGVGHALRQVRAGYEKVVSEADDFVHIPDTIALESPAFEDGGSIPPRYTADGEKISPPLHWSRLPRDSESMALIVEDADAPADEPLVHLIVWDLPPNLAELPEGELRSPGHAGLNENLGRNSLRETAWLPPDPPAGHGPHLYVFQVFALDAKLDFARPPDRRAVTEAMSGHVLAKGALVGTYERT
jgi:Raf kinase inhibitor-like YbhB/YbcL family protein